MLLAQALLPAFWAWFCLRQSPGLGASLGRHTRSWVSLALRFWAEFKGGICEQLHTFELFFHQMHNTKYLIYIYIYTE